MCTCRCWSGSLFTGRRPWASGRSGMCVRVAHVLSLLAAGATEDEILADYPYLAADDIKACLADAGQFKPTMQS